jgi:hypothetical protein
MGFETGERAGEYRITGVLGAGACGEVYRAEHTITKRVEALKVLAPNRPHSGEEERRFLREIQLHASLAHPNIASVHNAFSTRLGLVMAMELVEGESLETILQRGRVRLEAGIEYILQVLSALGHAHANSVLHRDVKPGNIVIAPNGTVKLTDFGLARQAANPRLTQTGTPAGSPYYMSPEQIHGVAPLDARSDVYSTGAVLYEVVTGRRPFEGESAFEVMQAHVESVPPAPIALNPAIGPVLNQVILTALEKDPGKRFQSAAEFHEALEAAQREMKQAPLARRGVFSVRRVRTVGVAAAIALALGAIILAGVIRYGEGSGPAKGPEPAPAQAARPSPALLAPVVETPPPPEAAPLETAQPETPAVTEEAAAPAETREPAAAVKKIRPPRTALTHSPELPAALKPTLPIEPAPASDSPEPLAVEAVPSEAVVDTAVPNPEGPKAEAPPQKRGNRVWRALGKIAQPWKSLKKDQPKPSQAPPE